MQNFDDEILGSQDYGMDQNMDIDEIEVESPTLLALVVDNSISMDIYDNVVPGCIDETKNSIINSDAEDEIIVSLSFFNKKVSIGGYQKVQDLSNAYSPSGTTALYKAICKVGNGLKNKNKTGYYDQIIKTGGTPKGIFAVLSDGQDNESRNMLSEAKEVVNFLNKSEIITVYIAFGQEAIGIGEALGFKNVINVEDVSEKRLRKIFDILSKLSIKVSKSNNINQSINVFEV